MNLYEAIEFFSRANPEKNVLCNFDKKCIKTIELTFTDGNLNEIFHVENNRLKVSVEGSDPVYIPIQSHRFCCEASKIKDYI